MICFSYLQFAAFIVGQILVGVALHVIEKVRADRRKAGQ